MTARPVTAAEAIRALEFMGLPAISDTDDKSKALIRKWAERGDVKKLGKNRSGDGLYDIAGILAKVMPRGDAA